MYITTENSYTNLGNFEHFFLLPILIHSIIRPTPHQDPSHVLQISNPHQEVWNPQLHHQLRSNI